MLLPDLNQRLRWWQGRLGLRDWKIWIEYVDDLTRDDGRTVWGLCDRIVDNRSAVIRIRTPTTPAEVAEVEDTIVHELLHCVLAPLGGYESATRAAEEQAVWTLSPLLVQLGASASGKVLTRAMARVGVKLVADRARSSRRSRAMDPKLKELLMKLLEMQDPEAMKEMIRTVVETMGGEGAPGSEGDPMAAEEPPGEDPMAAGAPPGEGDAGEGKKPYERAAAPRPAPKASSIAVQALLTATRARVDGPRKSKEERCRELRLPKDIADLAVKLPDDEFEDYIAQVEPMARQSGPVRTGTRGEGAGAGANPQGGPRSMSREVLRGRLPSDQRDGLARAFGTQIGKPAVGRTPIGELVMSHVGNVPKGPAVAPGGRGQ